MSGRSRMMYQSLQPEPEGAICPKRSTPQALHSSPHDTPPVSHTDVSSAYWLGSNIQGTCNAGWFQDGQETGTGRDRKRGRASRDGGRRSAVACSRYLDPLE